MICVSLANLIPRLELFVAMHHGSTGSTGRVSGRSPGVAPVLRISWAERLEHIHTT